MKLIQTFAVLCACVFSCTALSSANSTGAYTKLAFPPPLNWVLPSLEGDTISTYYKPNNESSAAAWSHYILEECKRFDCESCYSHSELTDGAYHTEKPYRVWFGIIYATKSLSLSDFRRDESENSKIQNAVAYVKGGQASSSVASTGLAATTTQSMSSSSGASIPVASSTTNAAAGSSSSSGPSSTSATANGGTSTASATTASATGNSGSTIRLEGTLELLVMGLTLMLYF